MASNPSWYFDRSDWPVIQVTGNDRIDYLHRMTSQHFKSLTVGEWRPGAFLNANGTVVGLFLAWNRANEVLLFVEPQTREPALAFLDKFLFTEDVQFQVVRGWNCLEVRGPTAEEWVKQASFPDVEITKAERWGEGGALLVSTKEIPQPPHGLFQVLDHKTYDAIRAWNLFPKDRVDIHEGTIILESSLMEYVHRNKGCYPGQEVVERIFTYGNVAKKLVLVKWQSSELTPSFQEGSASKIELFSDGKKVGDVTSCHTLSNLYLGTDESVTNFGLATVLRLSAKPGAVFSVSSPHDLSSSSPSSSVEVLRAAADIK